MRNFLLTCLALGAATFGITSAQAQGGNGFDFYGIPRTIILSGPQIISGISVTSAPVDLHHMTGIAKLTLVNQTNVSAPAGSMTATLQTSTDNTNWVNVANYALSTQTAINYTNNSYAGTNLYTTNNFILPGTLQTPTAATAGFATPYLLPAQFTNTTAITVTGNGFYEVGLNIDDLLRYARIYWTPGATTTNTVGAVLTLRSHQIP